MGEVGIGSVGGGEMLAVSRDGERPARCECRPTSGSSRKRGPGRASAGPAGVAGFSVTERNVGFAGDKQSGERAAEAVSGGVRPRSLRPPALVGEAVWRERATLVRWLEPTTLAQGRMAAFTPTQRQMAAFTSE